MSLKWKQKQIRQKAYWEQELKDRLAALSGKGLSTAAIDRNPIVRKIKAEIRAVGHRLDQITANEKRTEEMARIKAEKAAAPKEKEKEKEHGKAEKPKKGAEAAKEKKPKPEKKAGQPKEKAPKAPKPAEPKEPAPEDKTE